LSRRRRRAAAGQLEVLPGGGRPHAHLKQAVVFYIILALTALLILQAGYHWMGPFILARRLQIVTAEEGVMEQRLEVEGMVTRRELLLEAPCSGIIVDLAPAGERAAAGTVAAVLAPLTPAQLEKLREEEQGSPNIWEKIRAYLGRLLRGREEDKEVEEAGPLIVTGQLPPWLAERVEVILPEAGLLLHQLDGWENFAGSTYLTAEQFAAASGENFTAVEGLYVEKGRPILKLVDNWQWYFHFLLPLEEGRIMAAREKALLEFPFAPGRPLAADIVAAEVDGEKREVRLSCRIERQFPGYEDLRWLKAELIMERQEGVIIPAGALVEREGATGIYLNPGGKVKFKEVTVTRCMDERALVEGIEPGSMVIARPELVEEGQRLN